MSKQTNESPFWGMSGSFTPRLAVMFGVLLALTIMQGANAQIANTTIVKIYGQSNMEDAAIIYANNNDNNEFENDGGCKNSYSNSLNNSGWYSGSLTNFTAPYVRNAEILYKFYFSSVPGNAKVVSANFSFYHGEDNPNSANYDISLRLINSPWDEGGLCGLSGAASYNKRTVADTWSGGIFSVADMGDWIGSTTLNGANIGRQKIDIYGYAIENWVNGTTPNYGFILTLYSAAQGFNEYSYENKENGTMEYQPWVEIEYYIPGELPPAPLPYNFTAEQSVCFDDMTLYSTVYGYADNGSAVLNDQFKYCDFGCANSTITALGAPGCKESNFVLMLMLIIAVVLMVALIRWVAT